MKDEHQSFRSQSAKTRAPHLLANLSAEQIQRLVLAARPQGLAPLLILALTTGLRRGELLGLQWRDVNEAEGTLTVRRSLTVVAFDQAQDDETTLKDGKQRQLVLSSIMREALAEQQEQQHGQRARAGAAWQERGFVFTNTQGQPLSPVVLSQRLAQTCEQAGLPNMRFHHLRLHVLRQEFQQARQQGKQDDPA